MSPMNVTVEMAVLLNWLFRWSRLTLLAPAVGNRDRVSPASGIPDARPCVLAFFLSNQRTPSCTLVSKVSVTTGPGTGPTAPFTLRTSVAVWLLNAVGLPTNGVGAMPTRESPFTRNSTVVNPAPA